MVKKHDLYIKSHRPVFDIIQITLYPFSDRSISTIATLPAPTGKTRPHLMLDHITWYLLPKLFYKKRPLRSWSHKTHLTLQNV